MAQLVQCIAIQAISPPTYGAIDRDHIGRFVRDDAGQRYYFPDDRILSVIDVPQPAENAPILPVEQPPAPAEPEPQPKPVVDPKKPFAHIKSKALRESAEKAAEEKQQAERRERKRLAEQARRAKKREAKG